MREVGANNIIYYDGQSQEKRYLKSSFASFHVVKTENHASDYERHHPKF